MVETRTTAGTVVHHPADIAVRELGVGTFPDIRAADIGPNSEAAGLLDLLEHADLRAEDGIELEPPSSDIRVIPASGPLELEVDVPPGQSAVVLVERGGVYTWRYPEGDAGTHGIRAPGRLRFRLDPPPPEALRHEEVRGPIINYLAEWLAGKVRAYVLRFVARVTVDAAAAALESRLVDGLVSLEGTNSESWQPRGTAALPPDARRILLLIHGTFSSTRGSFGALAQTREGRAFLAVASTGYDAIFGYDHATLTKDPLENARELLEALRSVGLADDAEFDAIAFSRGGLVLRCLVEQLLPEDALPLRPRRLVFVGCTNGGTGLAAPKNWKRVIDLYTNLVLAGTRALGLVPEVGATSAIIGQTIESLSRFVQYLVEVAIDEARVPGLMAMLPGGQFVSALNSRAAATVLTTDYYTLAAEFEPRADAPGFTVALRDFVLGRLADRLFDGANDLIVDTTAMVEFGEHKDRLRESWVFEPSLGIYHTIYFTAPLLAGRLCAWLFGRPELAQRLVTDFVALDGELDPDEAFSRVWQLPLDKPVVICRSYGSEMLFYVLPVGEIETQRDDLHSIGGHALTLIEALDLHEDKAVAVFSERETVPYGGAPLYVGKRVPLSPGIPVGSVGTGVLLGVDGIVGAVVNKEWIAKLGARLESPPPPPPPDGESNIRALPVEPEKVIEALWPKTFTEADRAPPSGGWSHMPRFGVKPKPEPSFECQFQAEMPARPPLETPSELTVTLSREALDVEQGPTTRTGTADVIESEAIVVAVKAVRNCIIEGRSQRAVSPPAPGRPRAIAFTVRGEREGPAELWIEAFQEGRKLITMPIEPVFVAATATLRTRAGASTGHDEGALVDLRIRDITPGDDKDVRLEFVLESDELEILKEEVSPEHKFGTRTAFIESIYDQIKVFWQQTRHGTDARFTQDFADRLQGYGITLFKNLVPRTVREALWDTRDRIGCIRVMTREPSIPWELLFLFDPSRRTPMNAGRFLAEFGLVRWNGSFGYPPTRVLVRPGRAFLLIPEYDDERMRLKAAPDEKALVSRLFGASPIDATYSGVKGVLERANGFDLLHVACHGEAAARAIWNAGIYLENRQPDGTYATFRANDVTAYAWHHEAPDRPLIFLNACQVGLQGADLGGTGGLAQAFLESAGAGILAAPLWAVKDGTALIFATVFYKTLLQRSSLVSAVRAARATAKAAGEPSWLAYTVYGHPYARLQVEG